MSVLLPHNHSVRWTHVEWTYSGDSQLPVHGVDVLGSVAKDLINNRTQNFTLFIPCIFAKQYTTTSQQYAQSFSLNIYIIILHWTLLHISIYNGPSSGNQTKAEPYKDKLAAFVHSWLGVKASDINVMDFDILEINFRNIKIIKL